MQQAAFDLTDGVNCNTGEGTCEFGIKAEAGKQMKATLRPTDADKARSTTVMASSVLKNWAPSAAARPASGSGTAASARRSASPPPPPRGASSLSRRNRTDRPSPFLSRLDPPLPRRRGFSHRTSP